MEVPARSGSTKMFKQAVGNIATFESPVHPRQSSAEVVHELSQLEQQVIRFLSNAKRTIAVLGTLPGKTADDDAEGDLEEIVSEQLQILKTLNTELPKTVSILGNYRAFQIDTYEEALQNQDTIKRIRAVQSMFSKPASEMDHAKKTNTESSEADRL